MQKTAEQTNFHRNNRQRLRAGVGKGEPACELMVFTANSLIQASADRAYPFEQDSNFFYLTGITESSIVLVIAGDEEYLIVPERDQVRIAFEGAVDTEALSRVSGVQKVLGETAGWKKLEQSLNKSAGVGTLLQPDSYIAHADMFTNPSRGRLISKLQDAHSSGEIIDLRKQLAGMRMVKSPYEINMLEAAIAQTVKVFESIENIRADAVSERELFAEVSRMSTEMNSVYAYEPIIASGINAVTLHYINNDARIDRDSLLLLDIGLKHQGYSADITRTVSFAPTSRQQAVYDATLAVQAYAISLLKPGVTIREYEAKVQERMGNELRELGLIKSSDKDAVRQYYPHSTSHFLGIDVHDVGDYERPLEEGVVLTVEPGIYIQEEAIGIRIEDDILITASGNRNLTNALPKNLASLTINP